MATRAPSASPAGPVVPPGVEIRAMIARDYDAVVSLWGATPGVELNESDTEQAVTAFLERNPELSTVAIADGVVVGAVLAGYDGRRGYLHHLAVAPSHRRRGIARALLCRCLARLAALGLLKCNIFLMADNEAGELFWRHAGWVHRVDLKVLQLHIRPS